MPDVVPHDVTLIRTDSFGLPTSGGRIEERSPSMTILSRTPRLAPREPASFTVSLTAGRYLMVCTVPHHYICEAMVTTLSVTG